MPDLAVVKCRCGAVRGRLVGLSKATVNRVICYCDDCQAFAHFLGRPDLLDPRGGSDIVQVPPAAFRVDEGRHHVRGIRLTPKGILRWYAGCCNAPLGNMVSAAIPFVGIPTSSFETTGQSPDVLFGAPLGAIKGEYAIGGPPVGSRGIRLALMLRSIAKVAYWLLSGRAWPHPFVDRGSGAPIYPLDVLTAEQREALRPLCGPAPTSRA